MILCKHSRPLNKSMLHIDLWDWTLICNLMYDMLRSGRCADQAGRVWTLSNVGVRKAAAGSRSLIHLKKTTQNWSSCGEIGKKGLECSPTPNFLGIVVKMLKKRNCQRISWGKRAEFCVVVRFLKSHQI